jgi:hypothetical protein
MKKVLASVLVMGSLLILMVPRPTRAQLPGTPLRATIPFDFIIRGKTLPAGDYEIRRISDSPEGLQIIGKDNKQHVMFETEPILSRDPANKSELVFHRYGNTYFLYELWTAGDETGRELSRSRTERNLERELSSANSTKPETVFVALR